MASVYFDRLRFLFLTSLSLGGGCVLLSSCSPGASNDDPNKGTTAGGGGSVDQPSTGGSPGQIAIDIVALETCGNSTLDEGEACDDGNQIQEDGCSAACQIEGGWECPTLGAACAPLSICGDGKLGLIESCDDGNTEPGDGCAANCAEVEAGWQCRLAGYACVPLCGDSEITGSENCDDGNSLAGDGCGATCITEPGWSCAGSVCVKSVCGNGVKEAGESCDEGTENGLFLGNGQGCSKTCTPEPTCRNAQGVTQACVTSCGDGNLDEGEACDDGNQFDADGCSSTCEKETGFQCTSKVNADVAPCESGSGTCLVVPVVFRDFEPQGAASGHPDFFYMGATGDTTDGNQTTCVTNASGSLDSAAYTSSTCWDSDSVPLCQGLLAGTLGPDGKPNVSPTSDLSCLCRFTDWDSTGVVNSGNGRQCWEGSAAPWRIEKQVRTIKSASSFDQWYSDSSYSTPHVMNLELSQVGASAQYQFVSNGGTTIYDDLNSGTSPLLSSGFFPLESTSGSKLCNLWPYWSAWPDCVGQQWDPLANSGNGNFVANARGVERNFYFTTEARYLFRFQGGEFLEFDGDDDYWVYVNGKLVLDFGSPHERLVAGMTLSAANSGTATWNASARNIITGAAIPVGSGTVPNLGLEAGKTYEIAFFHADRHPRESNYKLTLSSFETTQSVCQPACGDGVRAAGEECDDGEANDDTTYGACTTECKFGPFCGDGVVNGDEDCDAGRNNTASYGAAAGSCAPGCRLPSFCGDGIVDARHGESCDGGGICDAKCQVGVK